MTCYSALLASLVLAVMTPLTCAQSAKTPSKPTSSPSTQKGATHPQSEVGTSASEQLSLRLGARTILIPKPDGFEEAASRIQAIQTAFGMTEDPNLDLLAVHVPADVFGELQAGKFSPLSFYTKVSVSKRLKLTDVSEKDLDVFTSTFEEKSTEILDADSPAWKKMTRDLQSRLDDLTESQLKLELSSPKNLGRLEKSPNVYSMMLLMTLKEQIGDKQQATPFLCAASFLRLNERLIFVYAYRKMSSEEDVRVLRDFSKNWTRKIISANRH